MTPTPPATSEVMRQIAADAYEAALGGDIPQLLTLLGDVCQVPMAALTLVGSRHVRAAATFGLNDSLPWPRPDRLHELLIATGRTIIVADAGEDARIALHPLVAGTTEARFAAAAPLRAGERVVGALCVFDARPHLDDLDPIGRRLTALAARVDAETRLRRFAVPDWLAGLAQAPTANAWSGFC